MINFKESNLTIEAVDVNDRGFYLCRATNSAGEPATSEEALIRIEGYKN